MKTGIVLGVFICLVLRSLSAFAGDNGDLQLWNTESIEVKLNDRWKAKVEEELRFENNISRLYYTHTDGGLVFKVNDNLDFGAHYRQIFERKKKEWEEEYRPYGYATFKWEWMDFKFSDKNRLEFRMKETTYDKWRYRNKLTAKFPWKWTSLEIQPYVADEIFIDLYGEKLNRNRLYGGFGAKLMKHLKTDIFYMWQTSKQIPGKWKNYNVIGVKLNVVF
jgi:hypothetical protein